MISYFFGWLFDTKTHRQAGRQHSIASWQLTEIRIRAGGYDNRTSFSDSYLQGR